MMNSEPDELAGIDIRWERPGYVARLSQGEVHVWCASLRQEHGIVQYLRSLLDTEEQTRAEKYYFERDKIDYVVGRGVLRSILSHYLSLEPEAIRFQYGTWGKPRVSIPPGRHGIEFNVSHSHGLLLCSVGGSGIGIDVELVREIPEVDLMAGSILSADEQDVFFRIPAQQRTREFVRIWTQKEALAKAMGYGLAHGLSAYRVMLKHEDGYELLADSGTGFGACDCLWFLQELVPAAGYIASLALRSNQNIIRCWSWDPRMASIQGKKGIKCLAWATA